MKHALSLVLTAIALLGAASPARAADPKPLKALLIVGGCCHDYTFQKRIIADGISARAHVEFTVVQDGGSSTDAKIKLYEDPNWAAGFDVVLHDECFANVKEQEWMDKVLAPHKAGTPAVLLHCAMHCYRSGTDEWFKFCGIHSTGHGPQLPIAITNVDAAHAALVGVPNWETANEELYNNIKAFDTAKPLQKGKQVVKNKDGTEKEVEYVVTWTNEYAGKSRVFATTLGHNSYTCADTRYLDMVTRGLLWACNKPADEYLKKFDAATHKFEWQDQLKPPQSKGPQPTKAPGAAAQPEKKAGALLDKKSSKENVAFRKAVSSSSFQGGNETANAVDGDLGTRWCAAGSRVGEWLQVDLGAPTELTGARILWEHEGAGYRYKLEGSGDAEKWRMLADRTEKTSDDQYHDVPFTANDVRYVRLTVVDKRPGSWASLFELELLGTKDAAPGTPSSLDVVPGAVSQRPGSALEAVASRDPLLAGVKLPAGYEALVFAAPPEVNYPTCLSAAPTGELFVGVDENGSLDRAANRGRVVKCTDTDGDGRADKFQDFAKMDSPRGLIYDDGDLYVLHPPKLSVYHDNDRDGVSDSSETLVDGIGFDLGFRGADHTTNGIRLGIDGWIYIAVGDYGFVKAKGKDGREQQLHGGGVARVRTDGTGLELVSVGQRNIYDVAIDPFMNLFTRDNTNDGGGWNVRLSHVVPLGSYGYPRLYMNFPDEIIPPLADYGGGSPCGALYLDEPQAFGPEFGRSLYTVEWGRSGIMRHPLTPKGASFEAKEETFINVPRPTDMDVDGLGNLYISSWRDGSFTYSGPKVGYLLKVRKKDAKHEAFPDLKKQSDEELVAGLVSSSGVRRLAAQRQLVRRWGGSRESKPTEIVTALLKVTSSDADVAARTAAIHTISQLDMGRIELLEDLKRVDVREAWIRAVGDYESPSDFRDILLEAGLVDPNPRVRLAAAAGIARLNLKPLAARVVPLVGDADPTVAHVAINALVKLGAGEECVKPLSDPATSPEQFAGCCRVLQGLHESSSVDGLLVALEANFRDLARRRLIASALCRLHFQEDAWDGKWWSTRPDTTGPYYKPAAWSETKRIAEALEQLRKRGDAEWSDWLAVEALRNRFELAGSAEALVAYMKKHPEQRTALLRLLGTKLNYLDTAGTYVATLALDPAVALDDRIAALGLLTRRANSGGLALALQVFTALDGAGLREVPQLATARTEFLRAVAIPGNLDPLARDAIEVHSDATRLALAALLIMTQEANTPPAARERVNGMIDKAWQTPELNPDLLRAIAMTDADAFADRVQALRKSDDAAIREAAEFAAKELRLDERAKNAKTIATMPFKEVLAKAQQPGGNAQVGAKLFSKQGCINCHAVAANEPPKGPFLGGISTRYQRKELIESILKPSAKIAQGFETQYVVTDDGLSQDGFIVRESGDEIELRNQNGVSRVIPKKSIEERGKRELSIMPTGLADRLTLDDLTAILAYLETLKGK